ncbi:MAG: hypothetical protein ACIAQF_02565 [Phycisphaerales bacterium JB065]
MPIKFALTMLVYAVCMLVSGYVTMMVSPPGAKPATALIIPGIAAALAAASAVLSLMIKSNRKLGMIGIHVGLVLPLLFMAGSLMRVSGSVSKADEFNSQLERIHTALQEPNGQVTLSLVADPDSSREKDRLMRANWVEDNTPTSITPKAPWKPYGYQSVGMISIAMLSVLAFVSLLLHRPEIPKAEPKDDLVDLDQD